MSRIYRCRDRTCGGPDCATCYGEAAATQYLLEQEQDDCDHGELELGICIRCGKDLTDTLQDAAAAAQEAEQER